MKTPTAKQFALVLIVALMLRLSAGLWWQSRLEGRFGFGDSESYWTLAQTVAGGEPYQYGSEDVRIFRAPGYPLLLAPIFWLAGDNASILWARGLSAVLGTLAVGGVWCVAWQLYNASTGMLAAAMAAVYPGAIAISALVLSEAAFCPLMLAQLALWIAAWNAPSARQADGWAVAAGLAAGAATLVRPSWLLFTPGAVLVGMIAGRARRRHFRIGVGMLAGLIVVMTPWWVRNARLTGHFVPTTLQVGASLYDGLNPTANGASNMDFVGRFVEMERRRPAAEATGVSETFEYRLDQRLRTAALAWARVHPGRAARLAAVKLIRMWNVWPNEPKLSAWPIRLAVLGTYVPILILGVVGATRTVHCGWPYLLCWLPAVYFTLLHLVFVSSIRYRQPVMLPLIVLAAGTIMACRTRTTTHQQGNTNSDLHQQLTTAH